MGSSQLRAEQTHYYITVTDVNYVPHYDPTQHGYRFNQSDLNFGASLYNITGFSQAFPSSRFEFLRQVYSVYIDDPNFLSSLHQNYPGIFVNPMPAPTAVQCFTPNDYGLVFGGNQYALDLIGAQQAWDVTLGDPSILVGMTDGFVNTNHPELQNKISNVYSNNPNAGSVADHGTVVAGLIGGETGNSIGLASIGYKTMVNISTDMTDNGMLTLSNAGMQVLNGSWIQSGLSNCENAGQFDLWGHGLGQAVYDEIYENNTFTVFGAGNGDLSGPNAAAANACGSDGYYFPASYDHNFSVTAVGQKIDVAAASSSSASVKDVHYLNPLGTTPLSTVHNNRVDLSAPGYYSETLDYDPSPTSGNPLYSQGYYGTSLSAPLVTGTAALMLAANKINKPNPCLSAYQLEYILKQNATHIDQISYNIPFAGKLGAGRLNAASAVSAAKTFDCNDPATQTMYVSSVDINSLCNPGQWQLQSGQGPQLSVTIANGTPPFSYNWVPVSNNAMHIDYTSAASPHIDQDQGWGASNSGLFYYVLQVTDASAVPKVASKVVKFQMKTSGYDLAMKDSPYDMYQEPNNQDAVDPRDWEIWHSPDIWNRKIQDGITANQEPEYFSGGNPNYVYVHIRNLGCAASPATGTNLHVYWTKASTGETWSSAWTTATAPSNTTPPGTTAAGGEITNSSTGYALPSIAAGQDLTIAMSWNPINPNNYAGSPQSVDACLLARIQESNIAPYGMATAEVANTTTNVKNNNNIVTRNTAIVNLGRSHARIYHEVIFSNAEFADKGSQIFSLQLLTSKDINKHFAGNLSDYMYATLTLDPVLFDRWVAAGAMGSYGIIDPEKKSVTYDPATPLRLDNISLAPGEAFTVGITFQFRGADVPSNIDDQHIYLRQLTTDADGDHVYGNVSYDVHIDTDHPDNGLFPTLWRTANLTAPQSFIVYPNPANDFVNLNYTGKDNVIADIEITDITGRHINSIPAVSFQNGQSYGINIASLVPGTYIVHLKNNKGLNESYRVSKL
ncbi:hypothetical protein DN068_14750 [Taibaiella soli]|uniref:Peptidase S8/S53 domain-containing protein n=1 Tax=Taibaiella soli TaxID=1649169 RepID=A0A2W2AIX4_9BACT|nr:hypothetical protein DN068_14750 [Taibaiella soli]